MVPLKTAMDGVHSFVVTDMIPVMPNGVKKIGAIIVAKSIKNNPDKVMTPFVGFMKMSGILSGDGQSVDEALLSEAFSDAFATMTTVDFLGFTFSADDSRKLVDRISRGQ